MPIKINSTGGGSVSIDVPSTGGTYTLTAPANNATIFTTDGGAITGNVSVSGVATFSSNVTFTSNNVSIGGQTVSPFAGMRNRIINGDMRIDQRYSGASNNVNSGVTSQFNLDRWIVQNNTDGVISVRQMNASNTAASNYESGSAPAGFTYSQKLTVSTADASIGSSQYAGIVNYIEGLNVVDLNWGTANAKTITFSFWVKSSVTGTYVVEFYNAPGDLLYPITYTISAANTWEKKTLTVSGPTTGTWLTNNGIGIAYRMWLTAGSAYTGGTLNTWTPNFTVSGNQTQWISTLNATFYFTGVQLEVGTVATPFENRLYGTELALCQRYYWSGIAPGSGQYYWAHPLDTSGYYRRITFPWPVEMRTGPTVTVTGLTSGTYASPYPAGSGDAKMCSIVADTTTNAYAYINSLTATAELGILA